MKGLAAFGFFLLFLAAIAFINLQNSGTNGSPPLRTPQQSELVDVNWTLAALRGSPGAAAANIDITFNDKGALRGIGKCQAFTGAYTLELNLLTFSNLQVSESRCADDVIKHETLLVAALKVTDEVGIGDTGLVLLAADGIRLARFTIRGNP